MYTTSSRLLLVPVLVLLLLLLLPSRLGYVKTDASLEPLALHVDERDEADRYVEHVPALGPSKCASGVVSSTSSASSASSRPCSSGWGAGGCAMELRAVLRPPPLKRFPPRSSLRGLQVRGIFPATKRHFRRILPRRRLSADRSLRRGDALLPGGLQRTDPGQAQNVSRTPLARTDGTAYDTKLKRD
eukprot:scaffold42295_cov60-Phaeocystis_antarctica.AAC.3